MHCVMLKMTSGSPVMQPPRNCILVMITMVLYLKLSLIFSNLLNPICSTLLNANFFSNLSIKTFLVKKGVTVSFPWQ